VGRPICGRFVDERDDGKRSGTRASFALEVEQYHIRLKLSGVLRNCESVMEASRELEQRSLLD
jgi:hypothetical protein